MLGRSFLCEPLPRGVTRTRTPRSGVAAAFNGAKPTERISHWCTQDGGEAGVIAWTATPIVDGEGMSLVLIVRRRRHGAPAPGGGAAPSE